MPDPTPKHVAVKEERSELLHNVTKEMEKVMVALAIVWIGLTITDIVGKLSPSLQTLNNAIWALFGLDSQSSLQSHPANSRSYRQAKSTSILGQARSLAVRPQP